VKGAKALHQGALSDAAQVGVRARDDHTLEIQLERPTGHFLQLLNYFTFPVPRHVVEAYGEEWTQLQNLVTNGPLQFVSWQKGKVMRGSRNPEYHGGFKGNVQQVEISFVTQWQVMLDMYEADELDDLLLDIMPPDERDHIRNRYPGEYVSEPALSTVYAGFDVTRAPFNDVRVRRAFALSADRETLAHVVLRGYSFPATGGFVPPGMPGHSPGIALPYHPERARQLLADAGYPGGRGFPVVETITYAHDPYVEYLEAQWRENLGVEMTWQRMDMAELRDRMARDRPPVAVTGWGADYPDPDSFLHPDLRWNDYGWRHEGFEQLVEKARRTLNQGERLDLLQQADRVLVQEAAIVPLTHGRGHSLAKPWVRNLDPGVSLKDLIIEPH
jgi:oligopeptide transport system substrate-binding protein